MKVNNEFWLAYIADDGELAKATTLAPRRRRCRSEYCLPARLPSTSFLAREGYQYAESTYKSYKAEQDALRLAALQAPDSPSSSSFCTTLYRMLLRTPYRPHLILTHSGLFCGTSTIYNRTTWTRRPTSHSKTCGSMMKHSKNNTASVVFSCTEYKKLNQRTK